MKKILNKIKEKGFAFCGLLSAFLVGYANIYAVDAGTEKIDGFLDFAKQWLIKIGGVIAMVGGVMFALSWQRDDAEGKSKALMTIMAGLMLAAVAAVAKSVFGF